MIVVVGCSRRLGKSPFLKVETPTTGSLPLMRRGMLCRSSNLIVEYGLRMSPGQEGIILRVKQQNQIWEVSRSRPIYRLSAHLKSEKVKTENKIK